MAERLILDVDLSLGTPGSDVDDGFALALAVAEPGVTLEMVTTVHGNASVDRVTELTTRLLERLGHAAVPVYRGAERPLLREPRFPLSDAASGGTRGVHATAAMIDLVRAHPDEITLVALGPLTNVALAMRLDPEFGKLLRGLVVMGGAFTRHTHLAGMPGEFNVWNDPEAARIVLTSGVTASWVGLDVTLEAKLSREAAVDLQGHGTGFAPYAAQCALDWMDHLGAFGFASDGCALHDPLAVAAAIHPELCTWSDAYVQVATDEQMRGMMLTQFAGTPDNPITGSVKARTNARVARTVDARRFLDLMLARLKELP